MNLANTITLEDCVSCSFKTIDCISEDHVLLKDSLNTYTLHLGNLRLREIDVDEVKLPVLHSDEYPNYRFIPTESREHNHLVVKLITDQDKIQQMFSLLN